MMTPMMVLLCAIIFYGLGRNESDRQGVYMMDQKDENIKNLREHIEKLNLIIANLENNKNGGTK